MKTVRHTPLRRELAAIVRRCRAEFGGAMPRRHLNLGLQQFIDNKRATHG